MRSKRATQSLSYPIRLPDVVQADALRLLDGSREVINATVAALWERLDEFGERETRYAYKQVTALIGSSDPHGDRQWRCEAEQAGRILRGQAERKKHFALILPLLEQGMLQPKTEKKRAGKNRKAIKQAIASLREEHTDGGNAVELQSLVEQSCNFYLKNGCFPSSYEEMQATPTLKSEGRGRGARGRWVNWRNNSQIRGALWRTLRYKCRLSGLHLAWQYPSGTTHTCPKCGKPANTYASPDLSAPSLLSGAWLRCYACGWNGARDYAAAINIALLGVAFLKQALSASQSEPSSPSPPDDRPTMTKKGLNSESYRGSGLALRLPPTSPRGRLIESGKMFVNGWVKSVTLHSALPPETLLRLCR
jgi:hypothetical protein